MNVREKMAKKMLEKEGYTVYTKGWPDFLAYNLDTNMFKLVEVKDSSCYSKPYHGLSVEQQDIKMFLKRIMDYEMIFVD